MDNKDFEALIKKDRDMHQSRSWRGNLLGYLEKVKADPTIAKLSHARTYDTIMKRGVRDIHENSDPHVKRLYKDESIKLFDFFSDEFFGIEKTVSQIVRYFHAASLKGEESRQVLYLMGPVGSGKSSLVEKLHRGLEESEPFYAIEGCPMFEEPLHLIPRHLRKEFEKMLGVHIEGDLCPVCRYKLQSRVRRQIRGVPGVHGRILQALARRHRRGTARRSEQPRHLRADRQRGYFQTGSLLRGRSPRAWN